MKQLYHLIKHDFRLFNRNKIILISILVTAIYVAVFKGLSQVMDVEKLLILVIFNDPALLGFLFIGVMVLFEKNENVTQVLSVLPMKFSNYILSKVITLTLIALFCCFAMVIASYGWNFNYFHFAMATIFTSTIFSFIGFAVVAGQHSFNRYIINAIGIILFLCFPFLYYFDLIDKIWFYLFPTTYVIDLYSMSFSNEFSVPEIVITYCITIAWTVLTFYWANKRVTTKFSV